MPTGHIRALTLKTAAPGCVTPKLSIKPSAVPSSRWKMRRWADVMVAVFI